MFRLSEHYSNFFVWLSILGGKDGIINPMVHNMAPAYDNAQYEYVWISTSRIKGKSTLTCGEFFHGVFPLPLIQEE